MTGILSNIPKKENEELYLKCISIEYKIEIDVLQILKKYFQDDLYFILNSLSGKTITFPKVENLNNIDLMIKIYQEILEGLNTLEIKIKEYNTIVDNKNHIVYNYEYIFSEIIKKKSKEYKITTDQVFSLYNKMKIILEKDVKKKIHNYF
jgi:hypothetical protein